METKFRVGDIVEIEYKIHHINTAFPISDLGVIVDAEDHAYNVKYTYDLTRFERFARTTLDTDNFIQVVSQVKCKFRLVSR